MAQRQGYLYRHWGDRDQLLYVGISLNAVTRLGQHRDKSWFQQITKVTVEKFETYEAAQEAELKAICYEGPIHNRKGPREASQIGPALNRLRAQQRKRRTATPKKMTAARRRLWDKYQIDMLFRTIPPDTAFDDYTPGPADLPQERIDELIEMWGDAQ